LTARLNCDIWKKIHRFSSVSLASISLSPLVPQKVGKTMQTMMVRGKPSEVAEPSSLYDEDNKKKDTIA